MKKIAALTLVVLALAGCSSETYKTGLGMVTAIDSSTAATAEAAGLAQADVTTAAVTVDSKGTIVSLSFDAVQPKVNYDATGAMTTDLAATFKTKKELGEDYGMRKASPIGKEWFEQIDALETYLTGKTLTDAVATPTKVLNDDHPNVPDVADLASTCTMDIGSFLAALEKAGANIK